MLSAGLHQEALIYILPGACADAMPQLFRSRVNTGEGEETHTKLFWYKYGKQVVYLDINELLEKGVTYGTGIDTRGSLKTEENGGEPDEEYTFTINDVTYYKYTNPQVVWFVNQEETDRNAMLSGADFKVVEDSKGNLSMINSLWPMILMRHRSVFIRKADKSRHYT